MRRTRADINQPQWLCGPKRGKRGKGGWVEGWNNYYLFVCAFGKGRVLGKGVIKRKGGVRALSRSPVFALPFLGSSMLWAGSNEREKGSLLISASDTENSEIKSEPSKHAFCQAEQVFII